MKRMKGCVRVKGKYSNMASIVCKGRKHFSVELLRYPLRYDKLSRKDIPVFISSSNERDNDEEIFYPYAKECCL